MPVIRDIPVYAVRERDGKIKRLLQSPDAELVSLVTGLVNLTEAERAAVDLCLRRGMTQEQAAIFFCHRAQKSFANLHFALDKYTQCVYNGTIR